MKVIYDGQTDTLSVVFVETAVAESDEKKPGIILDCDSGRIWSHWRFWMPRRGWHPPRRLRFR